MCETCSELKNTLTQRHLEKLSMFYAISNTIFYILVWFFTTPEIFRVTCAGQS